MTTPRPIALIGSSYVGAVAKAAEREPSITDGFSLDFMAASGGHFPRIEIADNRLINFKFSTAPADRLISDYAVVFIYARMPTPQSMVRYYRAAQAAGLSLQAREALLRDVMEASANLAARNQLKGSVTAPIYLLSSNIPANSPPLGAEEYRLGVSLIHSVIGDAYHEFPPEMLDENFVPREELYKGSLRFKRRNAGRPSGQARHHPHECDRGRHRPEEPG
ncbi:MAG: hypothetical protein WDN06_14360 [Asticcacaulis sp.]